jgi:predicted membrane-bound dolichyl-phosphate-mannose-protein mannosyltransferase
MKSSTMKAELAADNRLIKPKKPISNRVLCANFIEVITINVIQSLVALLKVFLAFFSPLAIAFRNDSHEVQIGFRR